LFDTQIVIWLETDRARLPARAAALVADGANDLAFSVVNIWEAVIRAARGRPDFAVDPVALRAALLEDEVAELPVTAHHVLGVTALAPIHRDPFSRLLIAQARAEGRRLLTADRLLDQYGDWVEVVS